MTLIAMCLIILIVILLFICAVVFISSIMDHKDIKKRITKKFNVETINKINHIKNNAYGTLDCIGFSGLPCISDYLNHVGSSGFSGCLGVSGYRGYNGDSVGNILTTEAPKLRSSRPHPFPIGGKHYSPK